MPPLLIGPQASGHSLVLLPGVLIIFNLPTLLFIAGGFVGQRSQVPYRGADDLGSPRDTVPDFLFLYLVILDCDPCPVW